MRHHRHIVREQLTQQYVANLLVITERASLHLRFVYHKKAVFANLIKNASTTPLYQSTYCEIQLRLIRVRHTLAKFRWTGTIAPPSDILGG
jgi:hypothetical protein